VIEDTRRGQGEREQSTVALEKLVSTAIMQLVTAGGGAAGVDIDLIPKQVQLTPGGYLVRPRASFRDRKRFDDQPDARHGRNWNSPRKLVREKRMEIGSVIEWRRVMAKLPGWYD